MGRNRDKRQQIEKRRQQRKNDKQTKKSLREKLSRMKGDKFKLSKDYIDYFQKFQKEISVLRVRLQDVAGDGNCLFRSFADQIDGNETTHKFMRQESCNYMKKNQEFFEPFLDEDEDGSFEKYIKAMEKDGEWGGHLQLQALCECFRCVIVIHKRHMEEFTMKPMVEEPQFGIIHLGYFQHEDFEHYVSIRQKDDFSELPAVQHLKHLNSNMYRHLLFEDEQAYMIQKQLEQMQIIEKLEEDFVKNGHNVQLPEEPFPGYPRNKKCKCGSKVAYKNCCFKEHQKNVEKLMRK